MIRTPEQFVIALVYFALGMALGILLDDGGGRPA